MNTMAFASLCPLGSKFCPVRRWGEHPADDTGTLIQHIGNMNARPASTWIYWDSHRITVLALDEITNAASQMRKIVEQLPPEQTNLHYHYLPYSNFGIIV